MSWVTLERQISGDGFCALANAHESEVAGLRCIGTVGIEAATIITDSKLEFVGGTFERHLHFGGASMFCGSAASCCQAYRQCPVREFLD